MTKKWYQSKTVWFNLLTIIFTVATFLGWQPNQNLAEQINSVLLALSPFINLLLRFVTEKKIE